MRRYYALLGLLPLILAGCRLSTAMLNDVPGTIESKSGNLVAFWLVNNDKDEPVLVTEQYAILIEWTEQRFFLYDNHAKTMFKTDDFDAFLSRLNDLPENIQVQRFDTCTVSRMYDMPTGQYDRLIQTMKRGTRTWAISSINGLEYTLVCYCESKGFRYP